MSQELYHYYEQELEVIRKLAAEFADRYPGPASALRLEQGKSIDPHVERLLEGFALLAGRVRAKLDDEFPELTDSLLSVLYPHYLAPVPSCLVAEFKADAARTPLNEGFTIPRHSQLLTPPVNPPTNDLRCRYRTAYPVTLWPITVSNARLQSPPYTSMRLPPGLRPPEGTAAILQIQLECQAGASFSSLTLDTLRFHLLGQDQSVTELYELMLTNVAQVMLSSPDNPMAPPIELRPNDTIRPVGFGCQNDPATGERDEGLLPYPSRSFPGYRLLTELFAYPAKFWFLDIQGLSKACRAGFGRRLDMLFFVRRSKPNLEKAIDGTTFRLGCTPAVNLFEQLAQPITLSQVKTEYPVRPRHDTPNAFEIYSIDEVTGVDPDTSENIRYLPFYDIRHPTGRTGREAFWYSTRKASTRDGDRGTDVYLTLVDRGWDPLQPASTTLMVKTTCSNRDIAARLGSQPPLEPEQAAPISTVSCVRAPTMPLRPPRRRRGNFWRLLSHLSLNHLSLSETDPEQGRAALQEILRLYDFSDPEAGKERRGEVASLLIEGITRLTSQRVVGRVGDGGTSGFCRGMEITIELDEEKYVGTGAYLFAAVIERFLGNYASINSFTQLKALSAQGERLIKRWPPRSGSRPLI